MGLFERGVAVVLSVSLLSPAPSLASGLARGARSARIGQPAAILPLLPAGAAASLPLPIALPSLPAPQGASAPGLPSAAANRPAAAPSPAGQLRETVLAFGSADGGPEGRPEPDAAAPALERLYSNGSGAAPRLAGAASEPVPVAKLVSALRRQAQGDLEGAQRAALEILADDSERRIEVRIAAIRSLRAAPLSRIAALLNTIVADGKESWYLRRAAAELLGARAAELGPERNASVEALKAAREDHSQALRIMSGWALLQLGEVPSPEKDAPQPRKSEPKPPAQNLSSPFDPAPGPNGEIVGWHDPRTPPKPGWQRRMAIFVTILGLFIGFIYYHDKTHPGAPSKQPPRRVPIHQQAAPAAAQPAAANPVMIAPSRPAPQIAPAPAQSAPASISAAPPRSENRYQWLYSFGPVVLLIAFMAWMFSRQQRQQQRTVKQFGNSRLKMQQSKPTTRFSDVAGIDEAVGELREIVDFLQNPAEYRRMGARIPKGVLLKGPPGTGKTLLARAVAGETGSNFFSIAGSDFVEMFVGVGAARVRQIFDEAKKNAPAVIFIDEIDAIGKARGQGPNSNDEREGTLNQLLVEMDGFDNSSGVIILAATNRADTLDAALLRPGRFDRQVDVGLPDVLGREAILAVHAGLRNTRLGADADLAFIANRTAGLSGAFLENVLNESALLAARRKGAFVSMEDLHRAVTKVSFGDARHLFLPDEVKRRIAYHEAGHVLASGKLPNKVTIIPHGAGALGFAESSEEETFLRTQKELEEWLVMVLGGLTAERLVFGQGSTGPGNDLERAENTARGMVERLAMGKSSGLMGRPANAGPGRISERTARQIDADVKALLDNAYAEAERRLSGNRAALEALAQGLLLKETLYKDEVRQIIEGGGDARGIDRGLKQ